jgi:glutaminyl-tRNA synthetase
MRRRGYSPEALRHFCEEVGTSRSDGVVDVGMLESAVRNDLNVHAPRAMAVLNPLALELTNLVATEVLSVANHPADDTMGRREVSLSRNIWIDREDFKQEANKKFKRLVVGKRVRLRGGYVIEADRCDVDAQGEVTKVYATVVPQTLGEDPDDGVKAKGVIHWVDQSNAVEAEIRSYDRLFTISDPSSVDDFDQVINQNSLTTSAAYLEASLAHAEPEARYQFEREGYFIADRYDHSNEQPVFNKVIGLRDTWGANA